MVKPMKRRDVLKKLAAAGFQFERDTGPHSVYRCPCGKHIVEVPRHREITPGVVRSLNNTDCMSKGWLQ